MQRLNRSKHAPVGTAFFLFLGLAILPVSLRVAGVQVSFSPRLSAAMDAWQQIAEVFGASYRPGTGGDLSVVRDSDPDPSPPTDSSLGSPQRFACAREFEEPNGMLNEISETRAPKGAFARRASEQVARRIPLPAKQVTAVVVASSEMKFRAVEALNALKLETREELLKTIERRMFKPSLAPVIEIRNLPTSKSMRVLLRLRRPATASSERTAAECKVFSALASERRHECDRALLTSMPSTSPDNSEF